jgi:hypothetical protein
MVGGVVVVSDIVERLRSRTAGMGVRRAEDYDTTLSFTDVFEAADEIERLRAERDRLRDIVRDLLALDTTKRELAMLDKGIGTATPLAAWSRARAALKETGHE